MCEGQNRDWGQWQLSVSEEHIERHSPDGALKETALNTAVGEYSPIYSEDAGNAGFCQILVREIDKQQQQEALTASRQNLNLEAKRTLGLHFIETLKEKDCIVLPLRQVE